MSRTGETGRKDSRGVASAIDCIFAMQRKARSLAGHCALCLSLLAAAVCAQTTTVSGTVYDPRITTQSLPLANVLVYLATSTPDALPSGVQCMSTLDTPSGVASATTAADGSFTLTSVPTNASYTLVIQAGKWRRQFSLSIASDPITGLALHMPANRSQGDIPLIAITTGSVDGLECVLRDMGISDSEFTDDSGTVNSGGRIHLYVNALGGGAVLSTSTPTADTLTGNATLLDQYDMVMFACPGAQYTKASSVLANVLNYANAGGRVYATHFSYVWLDPNAPDDSPFPAVANWTPNQSYPTPDPGIATVNTSFTDGATLSQWLTNVGASYTDTQGATYPGEVSLSTLRHDFNGVIAPAQAWLTLNDTTDSSPVMQLTFNTPFGATAAHQCGRVLFNEYHVMDPATVSGGVRSTNSGLTFPAECSNTGSMRAQEAMLEYALFDISGFVQPVVVPSLAISFSPSPLVVDQGDAADTLLITTTNTSSTLSIDASAVLTLGLPTGLTATALAGTGWNCTLAALTCTRSANLATGASDTVTLTTTVPRYAASGLSSYTGQIAATVASPTFSASVVATDAVIFQQQPTINWATPASILYGTALSAAQLNATSPVAGSFAYTPAAGEILSVGTHTLEAVLSPTDTVHYVAASATVPLTVLPAAPLVTLVSSSNPVFLLNPVTFAATVHAVSIEPSGTVAFYDGTTQLATVALVSGAASFTTAALTLGAHSIVAVYSGDANYSASSSAALAQRIDDFTLTVGGTGSATLTLGQSFVFPLTIAPTVDTTLPAAVSLSISGLPPETTASFSTTALASGAASSHVSLTIAMASSFAALRGLLPPLALCLLVLPFAARLRATARHWRLLALLAMLCASALTACSFQYTPKSATVTVTASSGALSHSTTVQVTVQ
jgi:hypothetical protein